MFAKTAAQTAKLVNGLSKADEVTKVISKVKNIATGAAILSTATAGVNTIDELENI